MLSERYALVRGDAQVATSQEVFDLVEGRVLDVEALAPLAPLAPLALARPCVGLDDGRADALVAWNAWNGGAPYDEGGLSPAIASAHIYRYPMYSDISDELSAARPGARGARLDPDA